MANDIDQDGDLDPTSVVFVNPPTDGAITDSGKTLTVNTEGTYTIADNGEVTFTPEASYNGTATTVTYRVTDDFGATNTALISVTVTDAPVANDDSAITNENTAVTFNPLANDSGGNNDLDPTSVVFIDPPTDGAITNGGKTLTVTGQGTYTIANDGQITFTPEANYNGTPTPVTYQVANNNGERDTGTISIIINDPPVAQDDLATANEDMAVIFNPLTNDTDNDGYLVPASVVFVNPPTDGEITNGGKTLRVTGQGEYLIADNAEITFIPEADYSGTPTPVTYEVTDNDGATDTGEISITVNEVNDAPVAENDTLSTNEDTAVTFDPLINDRDLDGNLVPGSVIFVDPPENGEIANGGKTLIVTGEGEYVIAEDGRVTFTPVANFNGTPTPVTYQVADNDGATDTGEISITVNDINDPPIADNDEASTDEDTAVTLSILENDSDVDGNLVPDSVIFIDPPANSTLSDDNKTLTVTGEGEYVVEDDGRVTFTPVANFNGTPTPVTYQVADDDGATDTGEISITVNDINDPPIADNDEASTDEDTAVTLSILENDSDVDGNLVPDSVIFIDPPANSTLSDDNKTLTVTGEGEYVVEDDGRVTFTPVANFNGTPTPVTYQVADDDGATDTGEISLTVNDINDPPVAENDTATTNEDTAVTFSPLTNDRDPDGSLDPASVVFINPPDGATVSDDNKTLTVANQGEYVIDPASGEITFTPVAGYSGTTTAIEYQVSDNNGGADTAFIAVDVNDAPVAQNDTATTNIDVPVTINPLVNDIDNDGNLDPASVIFINAPEDGTITDAGKTLTVTGQGVYTIADNGEVTFTPDSGYNGIPAPITYQVADNRGAIDTATISININNPPITEDDSDTTIENAPVTFDPLANDRDSDGNLVPSSVVFVEPPQGATLGDNNKTLTVPGEGDYVIADNGEITFTPVTDYSGTATPVTYQVADNNDATSRAQISLTVSDAPVAEDDSPITNQNSPITFDPLANDSGGDGTLDPGSVIFVNPPQGATLSDDSKTLTVPGEGEYVIADNGEVTFTPVANYNGTPTPVEYRVSDNLGASDTGTIAIDINNSPVAEDDAAATNENVAVTFNPLTNDTDSDGTLDPSSVVFVNPPQGATLSDDNKTLTVTGEGEYAIAPDSGEITFTPVTDYSGTATPVNYQVSDNNNATDTAEIAVSVNDAPVAQDDTATTNIGVPVTINPLENDTDNDGTLDPGSVIFINPPDDGSISEDGKTLTVTGQGVYTIADNGEVTFTPDSGFNGIPSPITYQVTDNAGAVDTATISVAINNPPVTEDDTAITNENTPITFNPLENDTDNDGTIDPSTVDLDPSTDGQQTTFTIAGEGTYTVDGSGNVTFTPEANYSGVSSIAYQVADNDGATNTAEIFVTVSDAPIAQDDTVTTNEDTTITFNPLENDSSGNSNFNPSSVVFVNPPDNGAIADEGKTLTVTGEGTYSIADNGEITFTPDSGYSGTATPVDYRVTNNNDASDTGTISLLVNDAPVAENDTATTNENTEVTVDLLGNDTDSDGTLDPTSVVFVNPPEGSTLANDNKTLTVTDEGEYAIAPDGQLTFTPETDYSGTATPVDLSGKR